MTPTPQRAADLRGAAWMVFAAAAMSLSYAFAKDALATLPVAMLVLGRNLVATLCFAPLLARRGLASVRTRRLWGHAWRTATGLGAYFAFVVALAHLSFGDAVALSFTAPLFSALLAVVLFGERAVPRRLVATAVGFAGVLLIAKPGFGFHWAMAVALASALLMSFAMSAVKQLASSESPDTIAFYFLGLGTLLAVPPALADWQWPEPRVALGVAAVGVLTFFGQLGLTRAYAFGTFSKMAPLDFLRLPFSVLLGLALFAESPDPLSLAGMALIAGAALAVLFAGPSTAR